MESRLVYHHSQKLAYRNPFGAVPTDFDIRLRLDIAQELTVTACFIYICCADDIQYLEEMDCVGKIDDYYMYEQTIRVPDHAQVLYYYFVINSEDKLYYYGANTGEGILKDTEDVDAYQITTYYDTFHTPDWLKHATIYQVFVDRYARSGLRGGLNHAEYHQAKGRHMYLHENWNEWPIYQPIDGAQDYNPCDFFGGDLQGVIDHLPEIAELGITCLYLNPIFESVSNHKYDTSDYMRIDPMFGNEEILQTLCKKAQELGIRIMLDGVFSHTGDDSLYFNKYHRYDTIGAYQSKESPYYPWYTFENFPEKYASWWGFQTMPEVNEMQESYQDFIATNENSVIKHWMKLGVSSWRLDVADELPDQFIMLLRKSVKESNPNGVLLGEVWEDASNKISMNTKRQYVMGYELDSVMNYPLRACMIDGLLGKIDMYEVIRRMEQLRENYPKEFFYSCMNLISSHDVPRALSLLGGAPDKDSGLTREEQAHYFLNEEQRAIALWRMRLAVAMQMALPGAPCIYYGDEVGMEGLMDPFNRQTYPWNLEDTSLLQYVTMISQLRRQHMILRTGYMVLFAPNQDSWCCIRFSADGKDAFGEACPDGLWIVLLNRLARPITMNMEQVMHANGPDANYISSLEGKYKDHCSDQVIVIESFAKDTIVIPPFGIYVLEKLMKKT